MSRPYRFDGFVLDLQRAALVTDMGESVPVRHQSFRLLCLFVENAGRLVEREAITQALWPGLTVSDDSITQCVRDLRRALRDEGQTKIKTVLRRGYIFTPEVTTASSIPSADQLAPVGRPSVAVLPFANMSGDPSHDYLADGVAENLTTELARSRSLLVIARTSSFTYRGRSVGVQQVARELDVQYVVEGSVQRSSDRIRITAQLVDARTSHHIWAERFDRHLTDLFTIQDEITQAIVAAIDPAISHSERRRALQKPPATLTAWEAWQRALWHWSKGSDLSNRLTFLQRTVELDPEFAPAHAMLVRLYLSEATRAFGRALEESVRLAEAEAQIALDLDPQNSMAHASLAWVLDHQGNAERHCGGGDCAQYQSERSAGPPYQGACFGDVGTDCRSAGIVEPSRFGSILAGQPLQQRCIIGPRATISQGITMPPRRRHARVSVSIPTFRVLTSGALRCSVS